MIEETLSEREAQRFYDRYGRKLEWSDHFEGRAKALSWSWCELTPGQRVLELGVGTGRFQAFASERVGAGGLCLGLDLSQTMLALGRAASPTSGLLQASVVAVPLADACVDWVYSSYTFDLLPLRVIPQVLAEVRRVLAPGGRLVACSLTEGRSALEKLCMGLWKRIHALGPARVGGCRPLELWGLLEQAGLEVLRREHVGQLGTPSEVLLARPAPRG